MKASFLPEIINDYRVFKGSQFIGTSGELELPELTAINETSEGAGVLGEIESPATGQFESMVTKIKFAILHVSIFDLMDTTKAQELTLRADGQYTDKTTGDTQDVLVKIVIRGKAKTTNLMLCRDLFRIFHVASVVNHPRSSAVVFLHSGGDHVFVFTAIDHAEVHAVCFAVGLVNLREVKVLCHYPARTFDRECPV